MAPSRVSALEGAAVALVLAVGAYLRLASLDLAQFRTDDFVLWAIARGLALRPSVLTQGMDSSLGLANGPFQAYLLLPAAAISTDPLAGTLVVALLNSLAIALLWGFARRYWGSEVAAVAALLFAVSPSAVVLSRRMLGNDLVAPFTVLLVWSLCDLARHGRKRDSVLPFLWLAIAIQTYVVALAHVVVALIGLALGRRRLRPLPLFAGFLLFATIAGPYVVGSILPDVGSLMQLVDSSGGVARVDGTSARLLFHLVSSEGYQAFATQVGGVVDATEGLPLVASLVAQALLVVGVVGAVWRVARQRRRREAAAPDLLALAIVLLPVLLLVRHTSPVYVLYFVTTLPLPYLFVALGAREIWRLSTRMASPMSLRFAPAALAVVGVAFVVTTHLALAPVFLGAIGEYWPKSDYGLPLRYTQEVVARTERLAAATRYDRVYVGGSGERDAIIYGLLQKSLPNIAHFDAAAGLLGPTDGEGRSLYVFSSDTDRVGRAFAKHLSATEVMNYPVPGGQSVYRFYDVAASDLAAVRADLAPSQPASARVGDVLEYLGSDLPGPTPTGEAVRLTTYWRVLKQPDRDLNLYVHLVGALGSDWGQWNGLGYPREQWQPGDVFVQTHEIRPPAGAPPVEYGIEIGAYFRATGEALPVVLDGKADDRLRPGAVRVERSTGATPPRPATPISARFGDTARLLGFDLKASSIRPGEKLDLTLYWQSTEPTSASYTVFNHLAGPDGRPIAQGDGPPSFGSFPTTDWKVGDYVRDRHEIAVPADAKPGRYWLLTGLYDPKSGGRLAPTAAAGSPLDRLSNWLDRRGVVTAGPRVDGDRVVLTAIDVGEFSEAR